MRSVAGRPSGGDIGLSCQASRPSVGECQPASDTRGAPVDRAADDVRQVQAHDRCARCEYDNRNERVGHRDDRNGDADDMCPFADRVRCRLHLGDLRALDAVTRDGATQQARWCVVTVLSERDLKGLVLPRHVDVHHIIVAEDDLDVDLTPAFGPAHDVIASAMARGKSVLVHCMGGISRSTTILAAHLILEEGLGASEAMAVIRKARRRAGPNASFWRQLKDLAAHMAHVPSAPPTPPPPPPPPRAAVDAGHA
ncbi:Protein tyrosine phosphatase incomplete domain containing protein [Pandoravirus neocaledonia]|uniref:Protein tyrosine phosphatase incomplete domain containing protein n=1 Tax=Pandoravirus neocaledonia TaxID=2107708 RepID=A0A2U7UC55_9VIRU|nr:Protein tyrosine phosphatase incomplete domain containing protein [Pandoravirus neocaledonia]AVK76024.1 Protein tyrosine phosphatase incomplete domain containing protein [Pandoravirus neocaledonia]